MDITPATDSNAPKYGTDDIIVLDTSEDEDPLGARVEQDKNTKYATGEDGTRHPVLRNHNTREERTPLSQISGPVIFGSSFADLLDRDAQPRDKDSMDLDVPEDETAEEEVRKTLLERMGLIDDGLHLMSARARRRRDSRG